MVKNHQPQLSKKDKGALTRSKPELIIVERPNMALSRKPRFRDSEDPLQKAIWMGFIHQEFSTEVEICGPMLKMMP